MTIGNNNTPNTETGASIREMYSGGDGGASVGSSATDLISFYGATPVAQRSGSAQAAVVTTAATSTSPYGFTSSQANAIVTLVNELRAALVALGAIKGS